MGPKWIATHRSGEWTIARIDVPPDTAGPAGTPIQPPPAAPRENPFSEVEGVTRSYGGGG